MKTTGLTRSKIMTVMNFNAKGFFLSSILAIAIIGLSTTLSAQTTITNLPDSVIEQRLVDLALEGPEMQKVNHQNMVNEYQLKSARNQWMNFLTLSANYNDQSFRSDIPSTYVYPKYFFGLNIPLGTIISSKQAKIAKEGVAISTLTQEETRRKIRTDVISKYRQYKAQNEIVRMETSYLNDLQVTLTQVDQKFKNNDPNVTFENYNTALKNRNDQQARLINQRLQLDLIKLELERMIGTSLESVLK